MAFASFCGLLTLQVGSAILATVFMVVGVLVFGVNVFEYHEHPENSWPIDLLLICIFVSLMILAGIIIFLAAYNESRVLCLAAVGVIAVIFVYWFVLTIFSFMDNATNVRRVCVENRCGASFWLANFNYRAAPKHRDTYTTEHSFLTDSTDDIDYITDPGATTPRHTPEAKETTTKKATIPEDQTSTTKKATIPEDQTSTTKKATIPEDQTSTTKKATIPEDQTSTTKKATIPEDQTSTTDKATIPETHTTTTNENADHSPDDITHASKKKRLVSKVYLNEDRNTELDSKNDTTLQMQNKMLRAEMKKVLLTPLSRMESINFEGDDLYSMFELDEDEMKENTVNSSESNNYVYGAAFVGAIIFSIVNLMFLLFSMVTMWSYAQELKWGAYYYDSTTYR